MDRSKYEIKRPGPTDEPVEAGAEELDDAAPWPSFGSGYRRPVIRAGEAELAEAS
jgi:hypothetical protein